MAHCAGGWELGEPTLVCMLPALPEGTHLVEEGSVVVHVAADGSVRAALNRCAHQAARLNAPVGCLLTCGMHGWQLDASEMRYLAPHSDVAHPEYIVEPAEGGHRVLAPPPAVPWAERRPRRTLLPGAFTAELEVGAVLVRMAGSGVRWRPGEASLRPPEVWWPLGQHARMLWLPQERGGHAILVEGAGTTLLACAGPLAVAEPPRPVDVVVAWTDDALPRALETEAGVVVAPSASTLRPSLRGVPVWPLEAGLVLDLGVQPVRRVLGQPRAG